MAVKWNPMAAREIAKLADREVGRQALAVHKEVRQSMRGTKSGRRYRIPGTNREYTASAPGETPAVRTGNYRDSIVVGKIGDQHYRVGTPEDRAAALEFGNERMEARPHFRKALEKVKGDNQ